MTDKEYEVMDELYFVQSFEELQETLHMNEEELKDILWELIKKEWIRCYKSVITDDSCIEEPEFNSNYNNYHYLATKAGMLAHNSK